MRKRLLFGCVLAVATVCLPQPATAQTGGDISVGYSFLTNNQLAANATNLPYGWFMDTSLQLNDTVSFAFDVSGHDRRGIEPHAMYAGGPMDMPVRPDPTQDFQAFSFNRPEGEYCSPILTVCEVHIQSRGIVGGPRFHMQAGGVRPYFHALFGVARSLRKIGFFAHTATHWAIQPGGGVDIDVTPNTAFRIQADYRVTMYPAPNQSDPGSQSSLVNPDGNFKELSFSLGVVVKLGARRN
jgi:hypothetical protein